ncbi:hypothetical protein PS691_02893 [Pseudomonas fluorescens]|uniref:Uncharacterized protein n=1 Tax=Pseudomonas fluorescens TaxID=294 RepID=A0A5E7CIZ1_PSEFL|nr:hypothetical protein PS691_02893 [Pseudomonas fluorescens]
MRVKPFALLLICMKSTLVSANVADIACKATPNRVTP